MRARYCRRGTWSTLLSIGQTPDTYGHAQLELHETAICCSRASASRLSACALSLRASASRFSTSPSPEPSSLGDSRPTRSLASLGLVGLSTPAHGPPLASINGRRQATANPSAGAKGACQEGPANRYWVA